MELRTLRYFLAIATERHFGRAAKTLYISQPSLSYAIKTLEHDLGVQLFRRHARGVDLTEAGIALVPEVTRILQAADSIRVIADQHRVGSAGRLRIGFEATGAGRLSTQARADFSKRYPDVAIEAKRYDWGDEVRGLHDREVDIAFVWLPADTAGLHLEVIAEERRVCALLPEHELASRPSISIMEIAREPIMRTTKAPKSWVDWWAVNPRPDGSEPNWARTNDNMEELLEQVAEGAAIGIVAGSVATFYARPDIAFVPIVDIEPLQIAIGWVEDNDSPLVAAFASIVKELAGR